MWTYNLMLCVDADVLLTATATNMLSLTPKCIQKSLC